MNVFTLRQINDEDHQWLVDLHNDPVVLRNVTHPQPITLESHMRWWNRIKDSKSEERLIFCVNGERAGLTKFYAIDRENKNCILGADLHSSFRGRGFAKPMWRMMIDRCFKQHDLFRISLTTAEYNEVAIKVYRSLGFIEEGKQVKSLLRDGKFWDQLCFYIVRE